jgi:hypothetical protein
MTLWTFLMIRRDLFSNFCSGELSSRHYKNDVTIIKEFEVL